MVADKIIEKRTNDNTPPAGVRRGRPRSMKSRRAILDSTRRLLVHISLRDLSVEAIAKKAGVGKTTIYRWWPNKTAVVMEAFSEQPGLQNVMPTTTGTAEALRIQLEKLLRQLRGQNGRIIANILAEGQSSRQSLDLFHETFLNERKDILRHYINAGKSQGVLDTDLDTEIALDMLLGPVFFRLMSRPDGLDDSFIQAYPEKAVTALMHNESPLAAAHG